MGFSETFKAGMTGNKAHKVHSTASQLALAGRIDEAQAKFNEARELYEKALEQGNDRVNILMSYSVLLLRLGEFGRAKELMIKINTNRGLTADDKFQLRINYAVCQWKLGNLDVAIDTINRAAERAKTGAIYNTLGLLLIEKAIKTGDYSEAIRFNTEAYGYDDDDPITLDNMGRLNMLLSERSRAEGRLDAAAQERTSAIDYLQKALAKKPNQATSLYYLAKLDHEDGDDQHARELISRARKCLTTATSAVSASDIERLAEEIG